MPPDGGVPGDEADLRHAEALVDHHAGQFGELARQLRRHEHPAALVHEVRIGCQVCNGPADEAGGLGARQVEVRRMREHALRAHQAGVEAHRHDSGPFELDGHVPGQSTTTRSRATARAGSSCGSAPSACPLGSATRAGSPATNPAPDPAKLARAARIVTVALEQGRLSLDDLAAGARASATSASHRPPEARRWTAVAGATRPVGGSATARSGRPLRHTSGRPCRARRRRSAAAARSGRPPPPSRRAGRVPRAR